MKRKSKHSKLKRRHKVGNRGAESVIITVCTSEEYIRKSPTYQTTGAKRDKKKCKSSRYMMGVKRKASRHTLACHPQ